jgi:hypothetical protein
MKRNWYARESIQGVLQMLGLPAVMDGSHVVVRGWEVSGVVDWLVGMTCDGIRHSMRSYLGEKYSSAMDAFTAMNPMISVRHLVSPGVSFNGGAPTIDGATMSVRFLEGRPDTGPTAYIVPVNKSMLMDGEEWFHPVALVPMEAMARWQAMAESARHCQRMLMTQATRMNVYNGYDYNIQPIRLSDIKITDKVRRDFVDDIQGFLTRRDWYESRRLPWSRKYVLNGPPGTGKTSLTRWAATSLGLYATTLDFTDKCIDGRSFTNFINFAKRQAPSLIVLDDFEKILEGDNRSGVSRHAILTAFSGVGSMDGVVVVVTCNSKDAFNGPMKRRFDVTVEFSNPTPMEVVEYMMGILSTDPIDWSKVQSVVPTGNVWSYDDARAVVTTAANLAFARKSEVVTTADVIDACLIVSTDRSQQAERR